jgi:hypothetical protein
MPFGVRHLGHRGGNSRSSMGAVPRGTVRVVRAKLASRVRSGSAHAQALGLPRCKARVAGSGGVRHHANRRTVGRERHAANVRRAESAERRYGSAEGEGPEG